MRQFLGDKSMIHTVDKKDLHIGISACLVGEKVRFDAAINLLIFVFTN